VLRAYFDESYDNRTMCVGGWLCTEDAWAAIEPKWLQRIEHERRMSIKGGHEPILRYHATDCANLKRQYKTWTIERQIQLTKKLIGILGGARPLPVGVAVGLSMEELMGARPDLDEKQIKWAAYFLCMCECFHNIGEAMDELFPSERVSVIHDGSSDFDTAALGAYQQMHESRRFPYAHYFFGIAPGKWQDFVALQPADLIAYEGFKLTAARKRGQDDLRKSLQNVLGHRIVVRAGFYREHGLKELSGG
jgi:hypothetical protein